jgi:hypothetical protein
VSVQAKQPYELFFEVRVRGDDQHRVDGDETVRDNMHDWLERTPEDAPASPLKQIMEIMDKGDRCVAVCTMCLERRMYIHTHKRL